MHNPSFAILDVDDGRLDRAVSLGEGFKFPAKTRVDERFSLDLGLEPSFKDGLTATLVRFSGHGPIVLRGDSLPPLVWRWKILDTRVSQGRLTRQVQDDAGTDPF